MLAVALNDYVIALTKFHSKTHRVFYIHTYILSTYHSNVRSQLKQGCIYSLFAHLYLRPNFIHLRQHFTTSNVYVLICMFIHTYIDYLNWKLLYPKSFFNTDLPTFNGCKSQSTLILYAFLIFIDCDICIVTSSDSTSIHRSRQIMNYVNLYTIRRNFIRHFTTSIVLMSTCTYIHRSTFKTRN